MRYENKKALLSINEDLADIEAKIDSVVRDEKREFADRPKSMQTSDLGFQKENQIQTLEVMHDAIRTAIKIVNRVCS